MIVILNANPSLDRTLVVDKIKSQGVIRGKRIFKHPDGKGMGVARVLKLLGTDYVCLNILGGAAGSIIYESARDENLNMEIFEIEDESRINTIVLDEKNETLVINEPGPFVKKKEVEKFKIWLQARMRELVGRENYFVVAGSFPRGFSTQDFEDILSFAHKNSFKTIVDISKEFLKSALKQHIWMIKVNLHEISDFVPVKDELAVSFVRDEYKIENVIVTAGDSGSFGRFLGIDFKTTIRSAKKRYAVGSGDAYLGGLIHGIVNHLRPLDSVKIATACGSANTEEIGPCVFKREHIEKWLKLITVKEIRSV